MKTRMDKRQENKSSAASNGCSQRERGGYISRFADNRPETVTQRKLQEMIDQSLQARNAVKPGEAESADVSQRPVPMPKNKTGLPEFVPSSGPASHGREVIQMVRKKLAATGASINLTKLEALILQIDEQIRLLQEEDKGEVLEGFIDLQQITDWRKQLGEELVRLRQLDDGKDYTPVQIKSKADDKLKAYFLVLMPCNQIWKKLNESLEGYNNYLEGQKTQEKFKEFKEKKEKQRKEKEEEKTTKIPKKTPTSQGPLGLGQKWGTYKKQLAWDKKTTKFHQNVPMGSETITKCLKSQNLLDAVYHTDKAFWVADPKKYKLGKSSGMATMLYTFTSGGACSLMEDYLLCGSGDFAEDNEEQWVGETAHPNYTIWKTNEIGAYGIGATRLIQLAKEIVSIEAYDPQGKKISV